MSSNPPSSGERALTWLILVGAMAFLLVTWWPALDLPLGDSHEGRILGRLALHMRNLADRGVVGSSYSADWGPFNPDPYNHHPPLLNALHAGVTALFGPGLLQLKSIGYTAGVLTIPAFAYLGRGMRFRPLAAAVAALLVAITPFYWVYGRLGLGLLPILLMAGALVRLVAIEHPSRRTLLWAGIASFLAVVASWQGVVVGAVLGLWLLWKRHGFDAAVVTVGGSMLGAVSVIVLWITSGPGAGSVIEHAGTRWEFPWTLAEFLGRQWFFADALLPDHFGWLVVTAVVVGLIRRKSRFVVALFSLLTIGFMFGPSDVAWIHDFYNFTGFLAVYPAIGSLLDWLSSGSQTLRWSVLGLAVLGSVLWSAEISRDEFQRRYFAEPTQAGELLQEIAPPDGQNTAWYLNPIPHVTWMSFQWDMPSEELSEERLRTVEADDLVLLRTDRVPQWIDPRVVDRAVGQEGRYALVPAAALKDSVLEVEG